MSREMMLGRAGEDMALEMLQKRGLWLLERNWRWNHKEIDLIMESAAAVHFIEVKTLRAPAVREPWEAVTPQKQRNLVLAAEHFIYSRHITKEVQFDIVSLLSMPDGSVEGEYIERAFFPII